MFLKPVLCKVQIHCNFSIAGPKKLLARQFSWRNRCNNLATRNKLSEPKLLWKMSLEGISGEKSLQRMRWEILWHSSSAVWVASAFQPTRPPSPSSPLPSPPFAIGVFLAFGKPKDEGRECYVRLIWNLSEELISCKLTTLKARKRCCIWQSTWRRTLDYQ